MFDHKHGDSKHVARDSHPLLPKTKLHRGHLAIFSKRHWIGKDYVNALPLRETITEVLGVPEVEFKAFIDSEPFKNATTQEELNEIRLDLVRSLGLLPRFKEVLEQEFSSHISDHLPQRIPMKEKGGLEGVIFNVCKDAGLSVLFDGINWDYCIDEIDRLEQQLAQRSEYAPSSIKVSPWNEEYKLAGELMKRQDKIFALIKSLTTGNPETWQSEIDYIALQEISEELLDFLEKSLPAESGWGVLSHKNVMLRYPDSEAKEQKNIPAPKNTAGENIIIYRKASLAFDEKKTEGYRNAIADKCYKQHKKTNVWAQSFSENFLACFTVLKDGALKNKPILIDSLHFAYDGAGDIATTSTQFLYEISADVDLLMVGDWNIQLDSEQTYPTSLNFFSTDEIHGVQTYSQIDWGVHKNPQGHHQILKNTPIDFEGNLIAENDPRLNAELDADFAPIKPSADLRTPDEKIDAVDVNIKRIVNTIEGSTKDRDLWEVNFTRSMNGKPTMLIYSPQDEKGIMPERVSALIKGAEQFSLRISGWYNGFILPRDLQGQPALSVEAVKAVKADLLPLYQFFWRVNSSWIVINLPKMNVKNKKIENYYLFASLSIVFLTASLVIAAKNNNWDGGGERWAALLGLYSLAETMTSCLVAAVFEKLIVSKAKRGVQPSRPVWIAMICADFVAAMPLGFAITNLITYANRFAPYGVDIASDHANEKMVELFNVLSLTFLSIGVCYMIFKLLNASKSYCSKKNNDSRAAETEMKSTLTQPLLPSESDIESQRPQKIQKPGVVSRALNSWCCCFMEPAVAKVSEAQRRAMETTVEDWMDFSPRS